MLPDVDVIAADAGADNAESVPAMVRRGATLPVAVRPIRSNRLGARTPTEVGIRHDQFVRREIDRHADRITELRGAPLERAAWSHVPAFGCPCRTRGLILIRVREGTVRHEDLVVDEVECDTLRQVQR